MKLLFLKTRLPRGIFLIPLLGGLLFASFWLVPEATHAASSVTNDNNCNGDRTGNNDVMIATNNGENLDCFSGSGTESVNLYNVIALETNDYTLTFNWTDQKGVPTNPLRLLLRSFQQVTPLAQVTLQDIRQ